MGRQPRSGLRGRPQLRRRVRIATCELRYTVSCNGSRPEVGHDAAGPDRGDDSWFATRGAVLAAHADDAPAQDSIAVWRLNLPLHVCLMGHRRLGPRGGSGAASGAMGMCQPVARSTKTMAKRWSTELELVGAGGEPVDLWRTISSHGVADLPPNRIDDEQRTLEVTVAVGRGKPRTAVISQGRPGYARVVMRRRRPRPFRSRSDGPAVLATSGRSR